MPITTEYQELVEAYASGVRAFFSPFGTTEAIRGSYRELSSGRVMEQGPGLSILSGDLTVTIARQLEDSNPNTRILASERLLAKIDVDNGVGHYLVQLHHEEDLDRRAVTDGMVERGLTDNLALVKPALNFLLADGAAESSPSIERSDSQTLSIAFSTESLVIRVDDFLVDIPEIAAGVSRDALLGLIGLGSTQLLQAAELLGAPIADALRSGSHSKEILGLANNFALRGYEGLLALLGPAAGQGLGKQVLELFKESAETTLMESVLNRFYGTEHARSELSRVIRSSSGNDNRFLKAAKDVNKLETDFRRQTRLARGLVPKLKYLNLLTISATVPGLLLMVAAYIALTGFVILSAGDFIDSPRVDALDRVPGLRHVLATHFRKPVDSFGMPDR